MKKEEQHEKGHRGMRGNNLYVGLRIILSGWRTAPMGRLVGTEAGEE